MFNKKLIAGSIFALMSAPALAVPTFEFTADSVSLEGAASLTALVLPEVTITSGAEYSDDDLIIIDYNVALDADYVPASNLSMYATCVNNAPATLTGTATENGGVLTLGLLSTDAAGGSVTYRVTDVNYTATNTGANDATECLSSNSSSVGAVVSLGAAVEVDGAAALAAGSVTGTYHATLPNGTTNIDGGLIAITDTATAMATYATQYSDAAGNTSLSGIIDVANADAGRSHFVAGNVSTSDALVTLASAALDTPAVITGTTFTLNGDFSFLVDEDLATAGIQNDAFSINMNIGAGAVDIDATTVTASAITWVVTGQTVIDDVIVEFDNALNGQAADFGLGLNPMKDGSFTYDVAIAYNDAGPLGDDADPVAGSVALTAAGDAGVWTLNGSTTTISNYPLSSAVTQFVWVTNTGAQTGGIFATAFGGTGAQVMTSCDLGVESSPGEIQRITDELNTCLTAAGMTAGRAEIELTVNAIEADISVYAGYKHDADADRLNLTQ